MENTIRIITFKRGGKELFSLLAKEQIPMQMQRMEPGTVVASGEWIDIVTAVGGASLIPSIAAIIVQWLKNRGSRKIIIQTKDDQVVHAEGLSIEELEKTLEVAKSISAIQPDGDRDGS
tara:strand:+ start:2230 stop:2586 length:357 start_codon:yes stop_codon:yes gene_type:complete